MTALITGGSRGIGAEIVTLFCDSGYNTAFLYLNSHEQALELARQTGAMPVVADVSDGQQVQSAIDSVAARLDGVDVLVNNAGIAHFGLFSDLEEDRWNELFSINVGGMYHCIQAVLPHMIRKKRGSIVNMSSIWGITGASCEAAYSATKAAVIGLTKALAKELGPSGIRVNCVAPGVIDTEMNKGLDPAAMETLREQTPLGVLGTPRDVAESVFYLASGRAGFITGQVLSPNGGFVI